MKIRVGLTLLLSVFSFQLSAVVCADTIYTREGREVKGIVVEDYKDRVVLSTTEGEKTLAKSDIKELYFDSDEDNLVKLAEQAYERRDFARAFTYYNMALKANPGSKAANDGLVFLQGYLFRKEEEEKLGDIKRRENIERYGTVVNMEQVKTGQERTQDMADRMRKTLGLTLKIEKGFPRVGNVRPKSPAYAAGIRQGDTLVSVWAKLTGYMSLDEVMEEFMEKPSLEIRCTIERPLEVRPAGIDIAMEFRGLTVSGVAEGSSAGAAGLEKDDLIVSIDGQSTRYMPINKAMKLMRSAKDKIKLTVRREVLIWRGE